MWYEAKYKINKAFFVSEYVVKHISLRSISRTTGADIRSLKRMLKFYGINQRPVAESIREQNQKNKELFKKKYGVENPFQTQRVKDIIQEKRNKKSHEIYEKVEKTNLKRYGVRNQFQRKDLVLSTEKSKEAARISLKRSWDRLNPEEKMIRKEKIENGVFSKYGYKNPFQIPEVISKIQNKRNTKEIIDDIRRKNENNGIWVPVDLLSEWEKYHRKVMSITRQKRKVLFSEWDGLCYYTRKKLITNEEFRKENPSLPLTKNKLQPTVDHKISIFYGFMNNIPPEEIAELENLCICSRVQNCIKNNKTEDSYVKGSDS
ncbi:MAG: hypothetical protein M0P12_01650 [Paludibacteraceae bacterium]|nr:hypothetical protein [Paludibacteraceae bacterium]